MNYFFLILVFLLHSCSRSDTPKQTRNQNFKTKNTKEFTQTNSSVKDIKINYNRTKIIADSIFLEDISFIRLETSPSCLIGHIDKVIFDNELIFIIDKRITKSVYIFNSEGLYKTKVDRRGKGPEEYIDIQDVDINTQNKQIGILDGYGRKIVFYSYEGKFIKTKSTAPIIFYSLASFDSSNYILDKGMYPDNDLLPSLADYRIISSDLNNIHAKGINIEKSAKNLNRNTQCQFWKFPNGIYFNKPFHDTIYRITKDSIIADYYLNLSGENIPYNDKLNLTNEKINQLCEKHGYLNGNFLALKDYIYFKIFYPKSTQMVFYSKRTGNLISGSSFTLHNPIFTFIRLPIISTYKDNKLVIVLEANFLKDFRWENCPVKEEYPHLRPTFDSLVNGLTNDMNPTLIFYTLKKF